MNKIYIENFKSRLYGVLQEKEKDGEWVPLADSLLLDLMGFPSEKKGDSYYILFCKISSLKFLNYKFFRKNILDSMRLIEKVGEGNVLL